jgi:transposase
VPAALPLILEDAEANLSGAVRLLLTQLKLDLDQLSVRIDEADAVIQKTAHENEACRRLVAIPGTAGASIGSNLPSRRHYLRFACHPPGTGAA